MLITLTTEKLSAVLVKVRIQHPNTRKENFSIEKSVLDEIRSLLEQTNNDDLYKLSFQFDSSKLLACVDIVAIDRQGDIAEKAAYVAGLRPKDYMTIRCWFKLVASYPNPMLEKLLKEIISAKGYHAIERHDKISSHLPKWLLATEIPIGILRDYQSTSKKETLDHFLLNHFLNSNDAIFRAVWMTLLTKGRSIDLNRQYPIRILTEIKSRERESERRLIGQHYLNSLNGVAEWSDNILHYIKNKWGKPLRASSKEGIEHWFWDHVKESAKNEFRRWLMLAEVDSFFEGERANFWRNYVNEAKIKDVRQILAGEGFMLDFEYFGVVEFKNVGNAAYIYPSDMFRKYWRGANYWTNDPSHFKDKSSTINSIKYPAWDGRILHFSGWQSTAKERINILMAEK